MPDREPTSHRRPRLAELARLECATDAPVDERALGLWRLGSAFALERDHRMAVARHARDQVREAVRACRSWDDADPSLWRDDTALRMRTLSRTDLRRCWMIYRRDMARLHAWLRRGRRRRRMLAAE